MRLLLIAVSMLCSVPFEDANAVMPKCPGDPIGTLSQQWPVLKLSKTGEQILHWMEDAESCFPWQTFDQLEDRERVIVSDLLRCANEKNTREIGAAAYACTG